MPESLVTPLRQRLPGEYLECRSSQFRRRDAGNAAPSGRAPSPAPSMARERLCCARGGPRWTGPTNGRRVSRVSDSAHRSAAWPAPTHAAGTAAWFWMRRCAAASVKRNSRTACAYTARHGACRARGRPIGGQRPLRGSPAHKGPPATAKKCVNPHRVAQHAETGRTHPPSSTPAP